MMLSALTVVLALLDFSSFTYCHESSRGPFEIQCVQLDSSGKGEFRFKRREADTIQVPIVLSAAARERFVAALAATNYIENGESYESGRKVADLGKKRLTIDLPSGSREAVFNYSTRKEVLDLTAFFEALVSQETLSFDMSNAIRFERLSVPKRLEQIENELKSNRIADPERLVPLLEKIETDQRLMNYARQEAGRIKKQIQSRKADSRK